MMLSTDSPAWESTTPNESVPAPETPPTPLIDVVACEGADSTPVAVASRSLGAEVRLHASAEAWFDAVRRSAEGDPQDPADVVAFVGNADRLSSQGLIARAAQSAPETRVLAALLDASLEHAVAAVNQGARGMLALPTSGERISQGLREVLDSAARRQSDRREAARHRRSLAKLTQAEHDVLDLMLAGLANKQIAQKLSIGLRTVELRRSKIMRKMEATSLSQLISFICGARMRGF